MRRRLRLLLAATLCLAPAVGAIAVAPPAGAVTIPPVLTAPASSSSNSDQLAIDYTLPQVPSSGSVVLQFVGPTNCTLTLTDAGSASFTLDTKDPASDPNVVSETCGTALADGTYTVLLAYQNGAGDPLATAFATNVTITSPLTLTPTLTSPAGSTTYNGNVPIAYTLPEPPLAGSVVLAFGGSTTCVLTMTDAQNVSFTLTPGAVTAAGPIAATSCATIPTGTYSVVLSYQDAGSAPQALTTNTAVELAPAIVPPTTSTTTTTAGPATTAVPTTSTVTASGSGNGSRAAAGDDLAATGAGGTMPATLVGLGGAVAGLGLLLLRRRAAG